jgi:hypothetical protein
MGLGQTQRQVQLPRGPVSFSQGMIWRFAPATADNYTAAIARVTSPFEYQTKKG